MNTDVPTRTDAPLIDVPPTDSPPRRLSRRQFFRRSAMLAAVPAVAGAYATQVEPFWPRHHEVAIPVRRLPAAFDGFRVLHLTDLHAGQTDFSYLRRTIDHAATLRPDLVLLTGDVVNHHREWADPIATLLGDTYVKAGIPVVASLGNHDYGYARRPGDDPDPYLHLAVMAALADHGCVPLRNAAHPIDRNGQRIWTVGLDDIWFGQFDPDAAFAGVPADAVRLVLSHNPDTAAHLDRFAPDLILAGHTHGGQVRLPLFGPPILNVADTRHSQGLFDLPNSRLYVSAGVGYIRRIRFNCRPEVPVFRLVAV